MFHASHPKTDMAARGNTLYPCPSPIHTCILSAWAKVQKETPDRTISVGRVHIIERDFGGLCLF